MHCRTGRAAEPYVLRLADPPALKPQTRPPPLTNITHTPTRASRHRTLTTRAARLPQLLLPQQRTLMPHCTVSHMITVLLHIHTHTPTALSLVRHVPLSCTMNVVGAAVLPALPRSYRPEIRVGFATIPRRGRGLRPLFSPGRGSGSPGGIYTFISDYERRLRRRS